MPLSRNSTWGDLPGEPWKHHPAKLTPGQRDEIVRRLAAGEKPMDLATEYGVTAKYIRSLRQG